MRPLEGLLVVDLSRLYPGPFCTAVLGSLGAHVVKVEPLGGGDATRWMPPVDEAGNGWAFAAVDRGKESVAVDTRAPEGVEIVRRLARRSDVLVESFRPGVLARVGLGADALRAENSRLVGLSLVGYAQDGSRADAAGHDLNYQSVAGTLARAPDGAPTMPVAQVADAAGAMYGAVAVLAALHERASTGRGTWLTVSLADAAVSFATLAHARAAFGPLAELGGDLPAYNVYRCADGGWLALGTLEPKFWEAFVAAAGRPEIAEAGYALGDAAAKAQVAALFAERPRAAWLDLCAKAGVPATPVLSPAEAAAQAPRVGPAAGLGLAPGDRPPRLGEHTDAWLVALGYDEGERAAMRSSGVVA